MKSWFVAQLYLFLFLPFLFLSAWFDPIWMRICRGLVNIHKDSRSHSISNSARLKSDVQSLWILLRVFRWEYLRMLGIVMLTSSFLAFFIKMDNVSCKHKIAHHDECVLLSVTNFLYTDIPLTCSLKKCECKLYVYTINILILRRNRAKHWFKGVKT